MFKAKLLDSYTDPQNKNYNLTLYVGNFNYERIFARHCLFMYLDYPVSNSILFLGLRSRGLLLSHSGLF